ncbi:protein of unknown function [Caballeronia sp. S22]
MWDITAHGWQSAEGIGLSRSRLALR